MERPLVLIVSRDEDTLMLFGTALRHAGFAARELADPSQALAVTLAEQPSLVITNFPTPATEVTVTDVLRGDARTAAVPILSVTSHVFPEDLALAAEAGVTRSLCMPITLRDLVTEVQRITTSG